ncbi:MAG TPA: DUF3667 domain-containing protein, partial [Chthoniobacterales bacterium]
VSAMEESPKRRLLRRRKAAEGRSITECENCGAQLHGHWCAKCGQAAVEYRRSFRHVIIDVLDSFLNWDSKFFATLVWLVARPWHLTNEFVRGRRVRYLHPIRLYLLVSILFFFVINYWAKSIHMDASRMKEGGKEAAEDVLKDRDMPTEVRAKIDKHFRQAGIPVAPQDNQSPAATDQATSSTPTPSPSAGLSIPAPPRAPEVPPRPHANSKTGDYGPILQFGPGDSSSGFAKWLEERAKEKIGEHGTKAEFFLKTLISNLPYMMLCCIPLFALILKLLYVRRRIFYIDHLVYALHIHGFAYAGLMLIGLLTIGIFHIASGAIAGWLIGLLWAAFTVQVFLSIRRVYRQGWIKSLIKFCLGGVIYLIILCLGLAGTFFATLVVP